MIIKIVVIIAFLLIIASLGSALYHLVNRGDQEQSEKTAKALTIRIGLSVLLFILIFIAYATGLIKPEGIGAKIHHLQNRSTQTSL
jgi:O-antigen/teichoic acid export membrane protein